MKLTVVTVVRNDPSVARTVESVLGQRGTDVECLVIDGASSDGTLEALRPFRRRARIVSAPDRGIYDAMNKGLALARGAVVGFLNAGDSFGSGDALAQVARAFAKNRRLDAVWGSLEIVASNGKLRRWWPAQPYVEGSFARGWMPSHPTFYAKRDMLRALGGFNTRYLLAADYDLMMRGLEKNHWRGVALPGLRVRMRSGGASQASPGAWLRHNVESFRAARAAGLATGPFAWFLGKKVGRKLFQLAGRPR